MPTASLDLGLMSGIAPQNQDSYFQQTVEDPFTRLPPVYVFADYSINVLASITDDSAQQLPYQVDSVSVTSSISGLFTYTNIGNNVLIETGGETPFNDSWVFLIEVDPESENDADRYGYTTVSSPTELVVNGQLDSVDLIRWNHPSSSVVNVSHTFTITGSAINNGITETYTDDIVLTQGLYFRYDPYTELVRNVAAGNYP